MPLPASSLLLLPALYVQPWSIQLPLFYAGQRVGKILEAVSAAGEEHSRRVSTATLNMVPPSPPHLLDFYSKSSLWTLPSFEISKI